MCGWTALKICLCIVLVSCKNEILVAEEQFWWRAVKDQRQHARLGHYKRYLDENPSHREPIQKSAILAHMECMRLFQHDRWNCSSGNPAKPYGNIVDIGCRETAFVYAINSAALVFNMIRACSEGRVHGCHNTCLQAEDNEIPHISIMLNGTHAKNEECDDNVRFGVRVWRKFVSAGEQASDIRARFNLRNSKLGVQEVIQSVELRCRCFGVSGSCVTQVCSEKAASNFETIGNTIYEKYQTAHYTMPHQKQIEELSRKRIQKVFDSDLTGFDPRRQPLKITLEDTDSPKRRRSRGDDQDMEFFDMSPDFCQKSRFSLGTGGRICLPRVSDHERSMGVRPCNEICCHGWAKRTVTRVHHKNCKFVYCCTLNCDSESSEVDEHYCL